MPLDTRLSIGAFSWMTFLSVKTLRHCHDVGRLAPAQIDPHSGYRYDAASQVGDAQLIRRLRDLQMPVPSMRELVAFLPVPDGTPGAVAGARPATTTYDGPFVDLDTAYGALGTAVLEPAIGGDGPVWERYVTPGDKVDLMDHMTVIGWPVGAESAARDGVDG